MQTRDESLDWPVVDAEVCRNLTPVMKCIVIALGYQAACEFVANNGGTLINLPKHESKKLSINKQSLARLRHQLQPHLDANSRFYCPMPDKLLNKMRDFVIKDNPDSLTNKQLAKDFNISERYVMILKTAHEKEYDEEHALRRQLSLDHAEVTAITILAQKEMRHSPSPLLAKILNKMQRIDLKQMHPKTDAQIDLF